MTVTAFAAPIVRRGPRRWMDAWLVLFRWQVMSLRLVLLNMAMVQAIVGVGAVLALRLWLDAVPAGAGVFATTGAATITLVMVGVVIGPQVVAEERLRGTYDYQWSLPVPRSAAIASSLTLNLVVSTPALAASVAAGAVVYDLDLVPSPSILPAVALTVATAGLVGSALAHAVKRPMVVTLATQVMGFVIFGFSPILFPAGNLPHWLATTHEWLPFSSMAVVVRGGLTDGLVDEVPRAYTVLAAWCAAGLVITAAAIGRRK